AGGGIAVVRNGVVAELLALPIGGVLSPLPAAELAAKLKALERLLRALGCAHPNPFLAFQILTFLAIPSLRISSRGLFDVKAHRVVDLFVT
ncbi:MAG: adenine deaminase C-terminal domain-containing protein, partial [Chloroflexota bacterium]